MRSKLLTSVAFATWATSAFAAPVAYVPPPIFSWTGFYAGGQVGYEFGRDSTVFSGTQTTTTAGGEGAPITTSTPFKLFGSTSLSGVAGGGHVGYNYAIAGFGLGRPLIIGVEGDFNASDYKGTYASAFAGTAAQTSSSIKGSARARLGIAVDRALFYATGGAAFADFDERYTTGLGTFYTSHNKVGYTVGGGVEYAITPVWSIRAEYRYSDYGSFTDSGNVTSFGLGTATHRETDNLAQLGVSYRFGP